MIEGFTGDIWRFYPHSWIVIPTNLGWTKDGKNVMGAGLAKQARVPIWAVVQGLGYRRRGPVYLERQRWLFPKTPPLPGKASRSSGPAPFLEAERQPGLDRKVRVAAIST